MTKNKRKDKKQMKKAIISFAAILLAVILPLLSFSCVWAEPADSDTAVSTTDGTQNTDPDTEKPQTDITEFANGIELYCIDTQTTLLSKNSDLPCSPSSSTKLMSALVAYELISDIYEEVTVTKEMTSGTSGLIYGFSSGMVVTYNDLLTAMLVRNANDAALILSRTLTKDTDSFVELMNSKASELNMKNTRYTDPTGQKSSSQTTVGDMMKLLYAFADNSYLLALSGLSSTKLASTKVTIYSRNYFLSRYYNGGRSYLNSFVTGGIADESGETLLSVAFVRGYTYLSVVAGASKDDNNIYSYKITSELLDWASASFDYLTLIDTGTLICSIPVTMGDGADEVAVFPAKKVTRYLDIETDLSTAVSYTYTLDCKSLVAPVSFGDKVGTLVLYLNGEEIEVIDLVISADIPSSASDYLMSEIRAFLGGKLFKVTAITLVSVFVIYIITMAALRGQRRKKLILMSREKEGDNI